MSNPNKIRAEKTINLGDKSYIARMGVDTLASMEDQYNMGFFDFCKKVENLNLRVSEIIDFLYIAIRAGGNDIEKNEVKAAVNSMGLMDASKILAELIVIALNVEIEGQKKNQ